MLRRMTGPDAESARAAVVALARATGTDYELRGRLAGGETGAHEIVSPAGERFVFKWETDPQSQIARRQGFEVADRLRVEANWPVPRQDLVEHNGDLFILQQFLPGAPVDQLSHDLIDQLLELHQQRLGVVVADPSPNWPDELIRTLTTGGRGYCLHESLRAYDQRTAHLVDRIEAVGRSLEPDDLPGRDLVHWDWHPGNLLQANGQLTAVIDTDFATIGDARFDLVTLAVSSWAVPCAAEARDRLVHAAFDSLTDRQRDAYVGHLLLRFLDWPIRRHQPDEIEFWLSRLGQLLPSWQ